MFIHFMFRSFIQCLCIRLFGNIAQIEKFGQNESREGSWKQYFDNIGDMKGI